METEILLKGFTSNTQRKAMQRSSSHNAYKGARWMGSGIVPPPKGWMNAEKRAKAISIQQQKRK